MLEITNARSAISSAIKAAIGGIYDAQDGNDLQLELGKNMNFRAEMVVTEGGLEVQNIQEVVPDEAKPVTVTEVAQPATDTENGTQQNSGGKLQTTRDSTRSRANSDRNTATGGGDSTTQDRDIKAFTE